MGRQDSCATGSEADCIWQMQADLNAPCDPSISAEECSDEQADEAMQKAVNAALATGGPGP